MKLKCDECEQVTEHYATGIADASYELLECQKCHSRAWVKVEVGRK